MTELTGHTVTIDDYGMVILCHESVGAPCRMGCSEQCDAWGEGDPWSGGCRSDHPMEDIGYCNPQLWINEDGGNGVDGEASIPVDVRWDPKRGTYVWTPAQP